MQIQGSQLFGETLWNYNVEWLKAMHGLIQNDFVLFMVRDLKMSDFPIFILPIFLVGFWLYYSFRKESALSHENEVQKRKLLGIFYSACIAMIICIVIQLIVQIERPESIIENTDFLILDHIPDASFPSDHAAVGFAFLVSLFLFQFKKSFWLFLPLAILMNVSRVIAGVHFPFDVIMGSIIGIISAFIAYRITYHSKLIEKLNEFIIELMKKFKL